MKKLAKILAVVMVSVLAVVALVACTPKPNTDYDKAKENLEKAKYEVSAIKAGETGAEQAFAMYASQYGITAEDIEAMLMAASEDDAENISMIWCKSEDAAKKVVETAEKQVKSFKEASEAGIKAMEALVNAMPDGDEKDEAKKELEEARAELKRFDDIVIGRDGTVAWMGTKAAIKATK